MVGQSKRLRCAAGRGARFGKDKGKGQLHQSSGLINPMKSSEAFTVKYYTGTSMHRKCVTLPQVQTQVGIKGKSTAFSLCDNVYMRVCNCARTVSRHTCAALSLHLCVTVILWAPEHGCPLHPSSKNQPLSPAVFASWSKPLPCRCFFWCRGTMGPVEVLSSSSIQFYKGQATPPFTGGMGRVRTWQGPGRLLPSVLLSLASPDKLHSKHY